MKYYYFNIYLIAIKWYANLLNISIFFILKLRKITAIYQLYNIFLNIMHVKYIFSYICKNNNKKKKPLKKEDIQHKYKDAFNVWIIEKYILLFFRLCTSNFFFYLSFILISLVFGILYTNLSKEIICLIRLSK